jgi:hypothetical protein
MQALVVLLEQHGLRRFCLNVLAVQLGLLLGALRGRIEKEIEGELDKLLAGGAKAKTRK